MASKADLAGSSNSSFVSVSPVPSITSTTACDDEQPPPYSSVVPADPASSWSARDPRSSSTQSLIPPESENNHRRILLLVYVHGFMGDETSFQSFPAHVHNLVSVLLSESHVIHTKIYPRYRSRNEIQLAAQQLSAWLGPRESPDTDIIILGHSLGGMVAAETVLIQSQNRSTTQPLRHRLFGTISFDSPFLGMHPGVIKSGLGSLFKPAPAPAPAPARSPLSEQGTSGPNILAASPLPDTFVQSQPADPNFNPAFPNDVRLPARTGWSNALHFIRKHSGNLKESTTQLLKSHYQFGSCLSDFEGLKVRYCRIRMLEEEDGKKRQSVIDNPSVPPRVRFINYYTASTGRPKKPRSLPERSASDAPSRGSGFLEPENETPNQESLREVTPDEDDAISISSSSLSTLDELDSLDPVPSDDTVTNTVASCSPSASQMSFASFTAQPPVAPGPAPSVSDFPDDPRAYRMSLHAHFREVKSYAHAYKAYQKAHLANQAANATISIVQQKAALETAKEHSKEEIEQRKEEAKVIPEATSKSERKKEIDQLKQQRKKEIDDRKQQIKLQWDEEKQRRKAAKHAARQDMKKGKQKLREDVRATIVSAKQAQKVEQAKSREAGLCKKCPSSRKSDCANGNNASEHRPSLHGGASSRSMMSTEAGDGKPPKDKKFCNLPPKDSAGLRDPCWQRVYMEGVDEVGAHCGLFFPQGASSADKEQAESSHQNGWGDRYARLVGDVAERIEGWIHDDMSDRMARGIETL